MRVSLLIALIFTTVFAQAKTTLYYKVKGRDVNFHFVLSETDYNGRKVLLSEGYSTIKYGIFYKGGFDFRGYNELDGNMILNVKCNWRSRRTKSTCVRVKFNEDDTFAYYSHKSSDLTLNEDWLDRSQTKTYRISDIQPGIESHVTIYDASSLVALTPYLNLDSKADRSMIIYTNYKEKISKSRIWIDSERANIQTIKVEPIYPDASTFKTLIVKIFYDKKRKVVTSFIQKVPFLGQITVELDKIVNN